LKARLEEILARRLREVALERGMPVSHVADRCGLAHSYFWRVLDAKASSTLAVVQRLADALEVDPLVLLHTSESDARGAHERVVSHASKPRPKPRAGPVRRVPKPRKTPPKR
jgi:transcriptional regulator with XRE-family HTH domain